MAERCRRLAGVWLLAVGLIPAPGAAAQGLSPQVDRDSPAGIEYQLPVERAREQAAGSARGSPAAADRAPLFGEGVTQAPRPSRAKDGGGGRRSTRPGEPLPRTDSALPNVRAQAPAPDGMGGGLVAIGAASAGVLLVGGLAGLGWRRRAQRP